MEEKELKTSLKTRIFIIIIAVLMLGSIVASYAAIVAGNSSNATDTASDSSISEEKMAKYEAEYDEAEKKLTEVSQSNFDKFVKYKSEIKGYNETSANEGGVQTRDLEKGSGDKLAEGDSNYLAYYVGWCADESIFDSTFDNNDNPKKFSKILDASAGMIEGWNTGVVGMRLGGIREITIPGELAYGDSMEICGGTNKPLRFLVMAVANEGDLKEAAEKYGEASMKLQYAQYGMDYEEVMSGSE